MMLLSFNADQYSNIYHGVNSCCVCFLSQRVSDEPSALICLLFKRRV